MRDSVRVLLLSDTHGQLHPGIQSLAREVDRIVHAGDIGDPAILDRLSDKNRPVHAVRGNNDTAAKWPAGSAALLDALPLDVTVTLPGGALVVEHGHRRNPVKRRHRLLRDAWPEARLVVYGHSHRQVVDEGESPWVVNPGAAGRSRTYGGSGCVLLTAGLDGGRLDALRFAL
jgi:putative phosphoesterase